MGQSPQPIRLGFTLLELIVAMMILALIMAMAIPRLTGVARRELKQKANELTDLMTMYAQRTTFSHKPTAIHYVVGADNYVFELMIRDIDEQDPAAPAKWWVDRTVRPVILPANEYRISEFYQDDRPVAEDEWFVESIPGQPRPLISLTVQGEQAAISIILHPYALAPQRSDQLNEGSELRRPVNLDGAGLNREDW